VKPPMLKPGDLVRVDPRWGVPHASAHRWEGDKKVYASQLSKGEMAIVSAIATGGVMVHIIRPDGLDWVMEKWDLSPVEET